MKKLVSTLMILAMLIPSVGAQSTDIFKKKKKKKEGPSWFEKTFNKLSNEIFSDDDMK